MLQYSLLLVEFLLLGATAYLYWTTRRLVENSGAPAPLPQPGWVQNQASVTQMAQDVATLVAELQTVAGDTRTDLLKQRAELQVMLKHAEAVTAELRQLVSQAEAVPAAEPEAEAEAELVWPGGLIAAPAVEPAEPPLVPLELLYSPAHFGDFLRTSGCGPEVVTLASQHAQEFMIWFTGQFKDDEPAPHRIAPHYLDKYAADLATQRVDADTIGRRVIALKAYLNWINNSAPADAIEPVSAPAGDDSARTEREALLGPADAEPPKSDRYRTVFSLAEEGLDQLAIAAKTGLEQEAVRMLLMMGQKAYAGS